MRLVGERIAVTENLARDLKKPGRRALKADLTTVRELIADEQESHDKSERISGIDSYKEDYRRNMAKAAANSKKAITFLNNALSSLKERDVETAARWLDEVVQLRGKKATQSRGVNVTKLYLEFQALKDTAFHQWLSSQGHDEVLREMGVSVAKKRTPKKDFDGRSNRPEDYE